MLLAVFQRLKLQAAYDSGCARKVSHIVYYVAIYCRVYYAGDFRLPVLKLNKKYMIGSVRVSYLQTIML